MLLASSVASAVPANAENPAERKNLCDRVDVAMSNSHNRMQTQPEMPMHLDRLERILRLFQLFRKGADASKVLLIAAWNDDPQEGTRKVRSLGQVEPELRPFLRV